MPTDAVWILATVPQKNFERRLITFNNKLDNIADGKFDLVSFIYKNDDFFILTQINFLTNITKKMPTKDCTWKRYAKKLLECAFNICYFY